MEIRFYRRLSLLLVLLISACSTKSSIVSLNPPQAVPRVEQLSSAPTKAEAAPLPEDVQIYRDENEMFALALPKNYDYESGDRGLIFTSSDGGFGGQIYYTSVDEALDAPDLEAYLKRSLQERFVDMSWQADSANRQADGSLRFDWRGMNSDGQALDGLSFIEQHGSTIYILTAYGIDRAYGDYNDDARIIAGSYVVRQDTAAFGE